MIKVEREFCDASRYRYDRLLSVERGFAQFDTAEDAWYFGTWASPSRRLIFNYAEGDCTTTTCESDSEFAGELQRMASWHRENDSFRGVDCGFSQALRDGFVRVGLADLLHQLGRSQGGRGVASIVLSIGHQRPIYNGLRPTGENPVITLVDIKNEFRMGMDGDSWGSCWGAWFAVADEMTRRGLGIPPEWSYRPGAMGPPARDSDEADTYYYLFPDAASDSDLEAFGVFLDRYSRLLRAAGRDY